MIDADLTIEQAVADSLESGETVELAWSRDLVEALASRHDLDAWITDGTCDGYACGLEDAATGRVWGIRLYNAADGGDR